MSRTKILLSLATGILLCGSPAFAAKLSPRAITGVAQRYAGQNFKHGASQAHQPPSYFASDTALRPVTVRSGKQIRVLNVNPATGKVVGVSRDLAGTALKTAKLDELGFKKSGGRASVQLGGKGGGIVTRHGNIRVTVKSARANEGRIVEMSRAHDVSVPKYVTADSADGKLSQRTKYYLVNYND